MTDRVYLGRLLTCLAFACALALWAWPEPVCRACGSEILRERHSVGIGR